MNNNQKYKEILLEIDLIKNIINDLFNEYFTKYYEIKNNYELKIYNDKKKTILEIPFAS